MVFLVILAGGVVRMTQSGMGCPDWPKCFGMWIPPTDASQLPADFEKYLDKQDIDHSFNVYHTWIEYINRLLGAILGLFIIINLWMAVRYFWKTKRAIVWWSVALLIFVGFQGWLGKLVVDSNLSVVKITTHMLVAILIAIVPLINISLLETEKYKISKTLRNLILLFLGLLTVQIVLGTQVREDVDIVSKALGYEQRELWIERLGNSFNIHRSFSWLILIVGIVMTWLSYKGDMIKRYVQWMMAGVLSLILIGIVMAHLNMLAIAQPAHLVIACGLTVGVVFSLLRVKTI